jgi:hypothetical protein
MLMPRRLPRPHSPELFMQRYPRLVAHMICCSLGYATPLLAARICLDAVEGRENWCEWIYSCYRRDPRPALVAAIRGRHGHTGYMAHFPLAIALVRQANATGRHPTFASWF